MVLILFQNKQDDDDDEGGDEEEGEEEEKEPENLGKLQFSLDYDFQANQVMCMLAELGQSGRGSIMVMGEKAHSN